MIYIFYQYYIVELISIFELSIEKRVIDLSTREFPLHAIVAVGCVLIKNEEILLVKRKYPPAEGLWAIPGGVVESNESIYEAAIRELWEETGLRAKPIGVIAIADVVFREENRVKYRYVIIDVYFDPSSIEGFLKPSEEVIDANWFKINEVVNRTDISKSTKKLVNLIISSDYSLIKIL